MARELAKLFVTLGLDDKEFGKSLDKVQKNLTQVGKVMTGIGAGITASLGLSVKAAAEEQKGIEKLSQTMANVGISYQEAVAGGLEKWINANQQATAFADSEQREALSNLILMTGDLAKAQGLLTTAMDLSRGTGRGLVETTQTLGYALAGNWGMVNRMLPALADIQTEEEKWAFLREKFTGQAETYGQTVAGQFELMKNNMGDMMEAIGGQLLPILSDLFKTIQPIIQSFINWTQRNPALTKALVIVAGAIGAVFVVLGPILMMLPAIAAGFTLLLGPVGLVVAAIAGLIAIGTLLWMNWDKVINFFKGVGEKIGNAFKGLADIVLAPFRAIWEGIGAGLNWLIEQLNKIKVELPSWLPGIGGKSFGINIPRIELPSFAGWEGRIPGPPGEPYLATVHGGEYIGQAAAAPVNINIYPRAMLGTKEEVVSWMREALLILKSRQGSTAF